MKHRSVRYYGVLIAVCLTTVLQAQWVQTNGPAGADVQSIMVKEDGTVFIGTNQNGIFRSTDNGKTWLALDSGLVVQANTFNTFAADEAALYAGSNKGVFISTDNGASWHTGDPSLKHVNSLSFGENGLWAGTDDGIFRSTDGGESWTAHDSGLMAPDMDIETIAVHDGVVFAGCGPGVYQSTDNGAYWTLYDSGLTTTYVKSLAVNGEKLFAGTVGGGIFRSTDNGEHWEEANNGISGSDGKRVNTLTAVNGTLFTGTFAGVFISRDDGETWRSAGWGVVSGNNVLSVAAGGGNVFAGTYSGIFVSTDTGSTWAASNAGLCRLQITSLGTFGNAVYASVFGSGIHRSTDNGETWQLVNSGLTNAGARLMFSAGDDTLYAGSTDGVFRIDSTGSSWEKILSGTFSSVAARGSSLYAGTALGSICNSINGGKNWTTVDTIAINKAFCALIIVDDTTALAATDLGIYRSTDHGGSWKKATDKYTTSFAMIGDTVFAGLTGGVYYSTNRGKSWSATGLDNDAVNSFAASGTDLFAGGMIKKVSLSTDRGAAWTDVFDGLNNVSVCALAVCGNMLFAGSSRNSVWRRPLSEMAGVRNPGFQRSGENRLNCHITARNGLGTVVSVKILMPRPDRITVTVFDLAGRTIAEPVDGRFDAGAHDFCLDKRLFEQGCYLVRVTTANSVFGKLVYRSK